MDIIETTKADYKKIVDMLDSLNEYQVKQNRKDWKERILYVLLGVIIAVLGAIAIHALNIGVISKP